VRDGTVVIVGSPTALGGHFAEPAFGIGSDRERV
jgi:hypothetical protein